MLPLFDNIPTRRFAVVTYALIAANFAVWVWELGARSGRIDHYAFCGGVAFAAHVGGFAFGFLAIKLFQVRAPLGPRRRR